MRASLVIPPDIRSVTLMGPGPDWAASMDRAGAATTQLLWQIRGERDLAAVADRGGDRTLLSLVDEASQGRTEPFPSRPGGPSLLDPLVRLEEERRVEQLRERLRALSRVLRPEEYQDLRNRLEPDLLPMQRILAVSREMERFAVREKREAVQRDFEAEVLPSRANELRAVMLFSRDGRLLAAAGEAKGLDVRTVSTLATRAEPGSTWSLAHRAGFLLGHGGGRAILVALFSSRPPKNAPIALRASMSSLEQRQSLLDRSQQPANQAALDEYLRAVRMLLVIEGS